jgi:hypothetical protein
MPAVVMKIDTKPVARTMDTRLMAATVRNQARALELVGDKLIADIRRGPWFTRDSGVLKGGLYKTRPRMRKSGASIDVGWGGPASVYGPVLETGPKKRAWVIQPVGLKTDGSPVKALRWFAGGSVVYAKKVVRRWSTKSLRPHFGPAYDRMKPFARRVTQQAMSEAWIAVGL